MSAPQLVDRMNREGIDIAVLLPLESPEGSWGYLLTEQAVEARNMYPERFIAFLCVDPRYPPAERFIDHFVRYHGCAGFGEHVNGLDFDDPLNLALYAKCDELGLPAEARRIHADELRAADEVFMTTTAGSVMPVRSVDGEPIGGRDGIGEISLRLHNRYWEKRWEGWHATPVRYELAG